MVFEHGLGNLTETFGGYPSIAVGDTFETGDLEALAFLYDFYESGCFGEAVVSAGVEPSEATTEDLDFELAIFEKLLIDCCYFKFATGRWLDALSYLHDLIGIEVETDDGIVAFGFLRLFFYTQAVAVLVELGNAVTFRVRDAIAKDGGFMAFLGILDCVAQESCEAAAVEDVITEDQADAVIAYELLTYNKSLCKTIGAGLLSIFEPNAVVAAITEQALEAGEVVGCGDDKDVTYSRQHKCRDGVIYHRLVIDGQQLFANALGYGIEAGSTAACENDSFHGEG